MPKLQPNNESVLERFRLALGVTKPAFYTALGWSRQRYFSAIQSKEGWSYLGKLESLTSQLASKLDIPEKNIRAKLRSLI